MSVDNLRVFRVIEDSSDIKELLASYFNYPSYDYNSIDEDTIRIYKNWYGTQSYTIPLELTIAQCGTCKKRTWIFVRNTTKYQHCEACRIDKCIKDTFVDEHIVPSEQLRSVMKNGPEYIQISKTDNIPRNDAPDEYKWCVNTPINYIFFVKVGEKLRTIGATKKLAIYVFVQWGPSVKGVIERESGIDIIKPLHWYNAFTYANPTLMQELDGEDDEQDAIKFTDNEEDQ